MSHVHASGTCNTFRYTVSLWNIGPPLPWTKPNSRTVFTDDWVGYDGSDKTGYHHKRIKHSAGVYVMGDIHTNSIDGFWSLIKRGIGVYHTSARNTLQSYLNEYSFRYNRAAYGKPAVQVYLGEGF